MHVRDLVPVLTFSFPLISLRRRGGDAAAIALSLSVTKLEPDGRVNVVACAYAHCGPGRASQTRSVSQSRRATCHGCRNAALEEHGFQRISEEGGGGELGERGG